MIGLDFFEGAVALNTNLRKLFFEKGIRIKTKPEPDCRLAEILKKLVCASYLSGDYSRLEIYGLTAELFSNLLSEHKEETELLRTEQFFGYYRTIEPAIIMMRDNYTDSITTDELAKSCRISKFHFCRIFKSVMGMSAIQYLNTHRLKIADTLIKNSDKSIGEIALICGFEDTSYFCRIYKKCYGKTPMQTKKEINS